jgi:hypothetical protein
LSTTSYTASPGAISAANANEVYIRLVDQSGVSWQSRAHFFGIAARIMRQILVDRARSRNAAKRGGADYTRAS